jgi:hypothetical protein
MKLVSTIAIAASLLAGATIAAAPAAAQKKGKEAAAGQAAQRKFNISKEAQKPLADLQTAVNAKNAAAVPGLATAAAAVVKTNDDKYLLAKLQLQHAVDVKNEPAQFAAIQAILASGGADAAETATLNDFLAGQAAAKDPAAAETFYTQRVAANPNDIVNVVNLASAKMALKKDAEALPLLQRAISMRKAAGQNAEEAWYRNAIVVADRQKNSAVAAELANEALKLYPNKANFNNLVAISQSTIAKDEEAYVDLLRLMQVAGNMKSSTDYLRLAQYHEFNRNWGEAKSVLEAAASAGKTSAAHSALLTKVSARIAEDKAALPSAEAKARSAANGSLALSIASVYAGYQDYTKAADLYNVALQKGGVDANLVNTRLGIAHVMAGQRAQAEAAFRKVTGTRAPLANLWTAWLAQRG